MRAVMLILIAAFAICLLWVCLANVAPRVPFQLGLGSQSELPLAAVILGSVAAGVIFTGLLAVVDGLRLWTENRRLRRQLSMAQSELHELRNLGLQDDPSSPVIAASERDAAVELET